MKKYVYLILPLVFVLALNIYFRSFPIFFPQLKHKAQDIVENQITQRARDIINTKYPRLYYPARDTLVNYFISDYKKAQSREIRNEIEREYARLKDPYQDARRQTYIMELDCWHWARYVANILKHGYPGDRILNGKQWDDFMLAPTGVSLAWDNFLFYVSAGAYRIFSYLNPVPLLTFLFYLPLFYAAVFIVLLYLFCFKHWGGISAIVTSLFIGLASICLFRSSSGWFDKEIFNLIFPLLILWSYLNAHDNNQSKTRLLWVFLASFWVGLYSFSWLNWWFIFLIIIAYEFYSFANLASLYLQYRRNDIVLFKKHIFVFLSFLFFTFCWIIAFCGFQPIYSLYSQVKGAFMLSQPITLSIWPNTYSTVGELKPAGFMDISYSVGGPLLFIVSLSCMIAFFFYSLFKDRDGTEHALSLILIFWFIGMYFACSKGIRFSFYLLMPLGLPLGWGCARAYHYIKDRFRKAFVLFSLLLVFLVFRFIYNANITAQRMYPLIDDKWYSLLVNLKDNTEKDAVINSWWDFGDWFKVIAERRVIFDGQSQNSAQAYWMARALISQEEDEAVAILRMLNNGGNTAFEIINDYTGDPYKAIFLLERVIMLKPAQAQVELSRSLPPKIVQRVIQLLYEKPQSVYFLVDYTMLDKMHAISFLGNWDFAKAYIAQDINKKGKGQIINFLRFSPGLSRERAGMYYDEAALISARDKDRWVSRRFIFRSGLSPGKDKNGIVFFDNGAVYTPKDKSVSLYSFQDYTYKVPESIFMLEGGYIKETSYQNSDYDFSVLLLPDKNGYRSILLDRELGNSLFVRLYFFNGRGLKHFKPFAQEGYGNKYIRVFKINWD